MDVCLIDQRNLPQKEQVMKESYETPEGNGPKPADDSDQHGEKRQKKGFRAGFFSTLFSVRTSR